MPTALLRFAFRRFCKSVRGSLGGLAIVFLGARTEYRRAQRPVLILQAGIPACALVRGGHSAPASVLVRLLKRTSALSLPAGALVRASPSGEIHAESVFSAMSGWPLEKASQSWSFVAAVMGAYSTL